MKDMQTNPPPDFYGYTFYPPEHASSPGHPRLDIILLPAPTGQHFDPERVQIPVVSANQELEILLLEHPWPRSEDYRVSAGRVILSDRLAKVVEAFSFGGELQIAAGDDYTKCTLRSAAPILGPLAGNSITAVLAQEVEILLAERRSAWAAQPDDFEHRLAIVNPVDLYHACLNELQEKFKHLPFIEDSLNQKFTHFLNVEVQARKDRYPHSQVLKLSDLV